MPKPTFWNLPAEKREALVAIALEEFAEHDYNSASISQIVARAEIAKGSLYQYFADKKDLFFHLLDVAQQTLLEAVQAAPPPPDSEAFFALLRWQMSATVRAALTHPLHSQLLQRAYGGSLPFRDDVLEQGRALREAHLRHLIRQGQARGDLPPTLNDEVAALVIGSVIAEVGPFLMRKLSPDTDAPLDPAHLNPPEVEQLFDEVIKLLEHGLRFQSGVKP